MRPISVTAGPLASASANAICLSQTPLAAGNLTLNGALVSAGVAVMDAPRQVRITTSANESGLTFTLTGTNWAGDTITETITGPNNTTADSVLNYATVTRIAISAAASGAVTVGTNGVGASPWVRLDEWAQPNSAIQCNVSGTVSYTVQGANDDPNSPWNVVLPAAMTWINCPDLNLVAQTAAAQGSYNYTPLWVRVLLNSGTGSVTMTIAQSGSVQY